MTPASRWAVMRAILIFHNCEGQSHKIVSTDHKFTYNKWGASVYIYIYVSIQWIINTKIAQHALKVSESSLVSKVGHNIRLYIYGRRSSKAIRYTALLVESLTAIVLSVYLIPWCVHLIFVILLGSLHLLQYSVQLQHHEDTESEFDTFCACWAILVFPQSSKLWHWSTGSLTCIMYVIFMLAEHRPNCQPTHSLHETTQTQILPL